MNKTFPLFLPLLFLCALLLGAARAISGDGRYAVLEGFESSCGNQVYLALTSF